MEVSSSLINAIYLYKPWFKLGHIKMTLELYSIQTEKN